MQGVTQDSEGVEVKLDSKGRCCGHNPEVYKRGAKRFCNRCLRDFDIATGEQVENWAWKVIRGEWIRVDSFGYPK